MTTLPSMAQMSDRSLSLAFVDSTVLAFPVKTTDIDEDAALQAAATKRVAAAPAAIDGSADNNATVPTHVPTSPPNFVPSVAAELALVFPSHAMFNAFLAEAVHWCGDFAAFRYGRPADFHSAEVMRALPAAVRDVWQLLDQVELTFCEEFHVPPSVFVTARRRATAVPLDATRALTCVDALLCEEDFAAICDVDYVQLSAMLRFLQARGYVRLHALFYVRKPM